jgi:hypothetical protein
MKDLNGFFLDLDEFENKIVPKAHRDFYRKVSLQVLTGVVTRTPVKTGFARGNWQVSGGSPPMNTVDRYDKTGDSTIRAGKNRINKLDPYGKSFISNLVPYIHKLENGASDQAPSGMVETTLSEVELKVKSGVIRK